MDLRKQSARTLTASWRNLLMSAISSLSMMDTVLLVKKPAKQQTITFKLISKRIKGKSRVSLPISPERLF